ncbi:hypothetical protein BDA96_01G162400 [Sorghum bicolor]|uniref:Uncharacterized protein n=2 Tax=Sorghum bicolor TaxID=4558 RepID=A0A921RYZ9_SORBI|nr:hypothetical protein BDA96_01G162400 [Sorghum bicolor]OQU91269.1 hypothetical protein SORBI_3001G154450 [Sorghum bicolor]
MAMSLPFYAKKIINKFKSQLTDDAKHIEMVQFILDTIRGPHTTKCTSYIKHCTLSQQHKTNPLILLAIHYYWSRGSIFCIESNH